MPDDPQNEAVGLPLHVIQRKIVLIRGRNVMFDSDLAELYGVETKKLIQSVKRNEPRFRGEKYMFQLTVDEYTDLRSQIVTANVKIPAPDENSLPMTTSSMRRTPPYAFTEYGVLMLSSVLRSDRAVAVSKEIVDAFVEFSQVLNAHDEIFRRLHELEQKYASHDDKFHAVFDAIRTLMEPPKKPTRRIGFAPPEDDDA